MRQLLGVLTLLLITSASGFAQQLTTGSSSVTGIVEPMNQGSDINKPFFSGYLNSGPDTMFTFLTSDSGPDDSGIDSIVVQISGAPHIVSIDPPLSACSRETHRVSILPKRPFSSFYLKWRIRDCAGNSIESELIADFNDDIKPAVLDRTDSSSKVKSITVNDYLAGVASITFPGLDTARFTTSVTPPVVPCYETEYTITVYDKGGPQSACANVQVRDCQGNVLADQICFAGTVTVEDGRSEESCELIGNPGSLRSTLRVMLAKSSEVSLRLVDLSGREVRAASMVLPNGKTDIPIEVAELAPGTYYIIAEWSGRQYAKKLQVVK